MNIVQRSQGGFGFAGAPSDALFELPLVSVIVVNYNYGHLLAQAVQSVLNQTYPKIECIIVDNASTDKSPEVLRDLKAAHSDLRILRRTSNDGQTMASLDGFALATGHYIIFLDADDALLPECVETHVHVHLSLRIHVGFTAVDMLQVVNDEVVVSTGEAMNGYIRSGKGRRPDLLRPFPHRRGSAWSFSHPGEDLQAKVHYVAPLCTRWVWAPTSGLCFRRDALALFADNPEIAHLRYSMDMYFAHGIGGWCGSVLIDEPLFVYRMHGSNNLSQRPQLNRTLSYQPGSKGDNNDKAKALIVDQLVSHSERFSQNLLFKLNNIALLCRLNGRETDEELPRWARRSSVARRLYAHFDSFAAQYGVPATRCLMFVFGVPWRLTRRAGSDDTRRAHES